MTDPRDIDLHIFNRELLADRFGEVSEVAVVGNGPVSPEDRMHVDSAGVVIRFNNWGSRRELREANSIVGGRCDVMFGNFDVHTTNQGKGGVGMPSMAVLAIPTPHRLADADRMMARWYGGSTFAMVNPFWCRDLCKVLGLESDGWKHPLPTVGLTALYHLYRMQMEDDVDFFVCGFSWHVDPENGTVQDVKPPHEKVGIWNHYYLREARWVQDHLWDREEWFFGSAPTRALRWLETH
jgi:hypothetical protein